jgi:hypothetical protein
LGLTLIGYFPYEKEGYKAAQEFLDTTCTTLDKYLETRTYFVGEYVTLADICMMEQFLMLWLVVRPQFVIGGGKRGAASNLSHLHRCMQECAGRDAHTGEKGGRGNIAIREEVGWQSFPSEIIRCDHGLPGHGHGYDQFCKRLKLCEASSKSLKAFEFARHLACRCFLCKSSLS